MALKKSLLTLGILGGGQLARMLALEAHRLGLNVKIISNTLQDPAALVASDWVKTPVEHAQWLATLKKCDAVTFESEFMDADKLAKMSRSKQIKIRPYPQHMALIQDRFSQKSLLDEYALPTAAWTAISDDSDVKTAWNFFKNSGGMVVKKRRFGYDGYGTYVIKTETEARRLTKLFTNKKFHKSDLFIAEAFIPFQRELACVFVRSENGEKIIFPFVESKQVKARCLWVKGPVQTKQTINICEIISQFLDDIGYVGAIAFEFFEVDGELLINELAPRVHNSGHYSLNAMNENQFSSHIKAVLGWKLTQPKPIAPAFAMHNLLGTPLHLVPKLIEGPNFLHWYGKKEARPGRKMGHINSLGATPDSALSHLQHQLISVDKKSAQR